MTRRLGSLVVIVSVVMLSGCSKTRGRIPDPHIALLQSNKYAMTGRDPRFYKWREGQRLMVYSEARPRCPFRVLKRLSVVDENEAMVMNALREAVRESAAHALIAFHSHDTTIVEYEKEYDSWRGNRLKPQSRVLFIGSGSVIVFESSDCRE